MKRSDGGPPYRKEADDGRELETDHDHASQGGEPGPGGRNGTVQQARRGACVQGHPRAWRDHGDAHGVFRQVGVSCLVMYFFRV